MSEQKYNKVFEFIKLNLVPKPHFDELQKEVVRLKSALENASNEVGKLKLECQEQKETIEILQAEKESLEAEKESLAAEKKTFEVKFNEVALKLKQKTKQYNSLKSTEKSERKNCGPKDIEKVSVGTQTIKEEPKDIEIENFRKTGAKRKHSSRDDAQRVKAKRKKSMLSNSDPILQAARKSAKKFSCESCLDDWGLAIKHDYRGDPDQCDAPDPKQNIQTFSSFEDYKDHHIAAHALSIEDLCEEKSCHLYSDHNDQGLWPHGDISCKICGLSFKVQKHHDEHMKFEHADINNLKNKEIYDLFLKYQGVSDQ